MHKRLKGKRFFKTLQKRIVPIFVIAIILAILAITEHFLIHRTVYGNAYKELSSWADLTSAEINCKTKWDLTGFRRSSTAVPNWVVISEDGLVIDIEDFFPDLFGTLGKVLPIDTSIFKGSKSVKSSTGETWRLLGKKLLGGTVAVGINSPENLAEADEKLQTDIAKFGSTIDQAMSVRSRDVDILTEYAVITTNGELKNAIGGVPIRTSSDLLLTLSAGITNYTVNGKSYLLFTKALFNSQNQRVGIVVIPKEMNLEDQMLRIQDRINYSAVGIAGLLIIIIVLIFVVREFIQQRKHISLQDALRTGESLTVEFKSSFHWDVRQNKQVEDRKLDILKSIAAFLNSKGGTLFIGVEEDKTGEIKVRGIAEDLKVHNNSKDHLQLALRSLIAEKIGAKFSPFIEENFEEASGQICWKIAIDSSPEPAFVNWNNQKRFFVREGPRTHDLDNEDTWRYITNRWGKNL
jgi:hypothetical protein